MKDNACGTADDDDDGVDDDDHGDDGYRHDAKPSMLIPTLTSSKHPILQTSTSCFELLGVGECRTFTSLVGIEVRLRNIQLLTNALKVLHKRKYKSY